MFNELAKAQQGAIPSDDKSEITERRPNAIPKIALEEQTSSENSSILGSGSHQDIGFYLDEPTKTLLTRINEYDFPIFELADATNDRPLFVMSHQLVVESGLLDRLKFSKAKFHKFMWSIEAGYSSDLSCKLSR